MRMEIAEKAGMEDFVPETENSFLEQDDWSRESDFNEREQIFCVRTRLPGALAWELDSGQDSEQFN